MKEDERARPICRCSCDYCMSGGCGCFGPQTSREVEYRTDYRLWPADEPYPEPVEFPEPTELDPMLKQWLNDE